VGGRLADKIVAELSGKTAKFALARGSEPLAAKDETPPPFADEALEVLVQLQYTRNEAREMLEKAMKANPKITRAEDLISVIFKSGLGSKGDN
jgi:Holliday junction resolvasome RuvABC DNA-binding subunit